MITEVPRVVVIRKHHVFGGKRIVSFYHQRNDETKYIISRPFDSKKEAIEHLSESIALMKWYDVHGEHHCTSSCRRNKTTSN